jgi:hypothetical protein
VQKACYVHLWLFSARLILRAMKAVRTVDTYYQMIDTIQIADNVGPLSSNRRSCYTNESHIVPGVKEWFFFFPFLFVIN